MPPIRTRLIRIVPPNGPASERGDDANPVTASAQVAAASRTVREAATSVRPRSPGAPTGFVAATEAGKAASGATNAGLRGQRLGGGPPPRPPFSPPAAP